MKYIKQFQNHLDYETFIASADFITPNVSLCVQQSEVHYNPPHDYSQDYLTFEAVQNCTFKFTKRINYSIDGGITWNSLAAINETPIITAGSKIMWKAELTPNSSDGIGTFVSQSKFNIEGNPMSLLYGDNFIGQTDLTGKNYAFYKLFRGRSTLINAENLSLPATTLASYCYNYMFENCTGLIATPKLPAKTLANNCYDGMFRGCTALTTAPKLSATALADYCYNNMFANCTSLTTAPELPVTTLATCCYYYMFKGCTNLTTAPELPATTLAGGCYQDMFRDCTSLTTAPELPAITLASSCYYEMFYGCTALTTAPELPATTLEWYCYESMFQGCTNLNSITCLATDISARMCTTSWVDGVASTGVFIKAPSMTEWTIDKNGIPTGWTVQTASA